MSLPASGEAARDLGGVLLLDTHHTGLEGTVGVYLVPTREGRFALVETGPGSTLPRLREAIAAAGYDPADCERIFVTHIHLDHAGAAGALAAESGAHVVVHERGARHLAAPERLLASAARIYGDAMERLWGEMRPVPEALIVATAGDETFRVGDRSLRAVDAPGHASHHLGFLLDGEDLFTGDAAGVRLDGFPLLRPAVPPPETDLEAWEVTVRRLRALRPKRLLLTHFGSVEDADAHLALVPERNRAWADAVRRGLVEGEDEAALTERMRRLEDRELEAAGAPERTGERYRATSNAAMTAAGLARYWRTRAPEGLEP